MWTREYSEPPVLTNTGLTGLTGLGGLLAGWDGGKSVMSDDPSIPAQGSAECLKREGPALALVLALALTEEEPNARGLVRGNAGQSLSRQGVWQGLPWLVWGGGLCGTMAACRLALVLPLQLSWRRCKVEQKRALSCAKCRVILEMQLLAVAAAAVAVARP